MGRRTTLESGSILTAARTKSGGTKQSTGVAGIVPLTKQSIPATAVIAVVIGANNSSMAMASQFLSLSWNDETQCWSGTVHFAGRDLKSLIDFDIDDPSDKERNRAVELAKDLLSSLSPEWELKCRRRAAQEITEGTYSQSESSMPSNAIDELLSDMTLDALEFSYAPEDDETIGILGYTAPTCFPGMNLQVNFLDDLSIDEIMVTD